MTKEIKDLFNTILNSSSTGDDDMTIVLEFDLEGSEDWTDELTDAMSLLFETDVMSPVFDVEEDEEEDVDDTNNRDLQEEDFVASLVEEQLNIEEANDPDDIERWDLINELLALYLTKEGFEELATRNVNSDWVETVLENYSGEPRVSIETLVVTPDSDEEDFVNAVDDFLKKLSGA